MDRTWLSAVIAKLEQWRAFNPAIGGLLATVVLCRSCDACDCPERSRFDLGRRSAHHILGALTIAARSSGWVIERCWRAE